MKTDDIGGPWHPGSGKVADRTDHAIAALLQQNFSKFPTDALDQGIEYGADVHSDGTIKKYRKLVTEHGPFERIGPGLWRVRR